MTTWPKVSKCVMLFLTLLFNDKASAERWSHQYLDCINKAGTHRWYAYDSSNLFKPFLEKYGTKSSDRRIKNVAYSDNKFLYILGVDYDAADNATAMLVLDRNRKDAKGNVGLPVVFDNEWQAKEFCGALSNLCKNTMGDGKKLNGDEYKYVEGNRDYVWHELTRITVQYGYLNRPHYYACDGGDYFLRK